MSFKYMELHDVFAHEKALLNFSDGINIITGKNRMGKSSICEAICFALTNQTTKSNLSDMIRDGQEKAAVGFEYTGLPYITKVRKQTSTSVHGMPKQDLDSKINLSFNEFKNLFYISSSDDFSLFDSSYLAKFLEEVFMLQQYSKTYDRLRGELSTLEKVKQSHEAMQDLISKKQKYEYAVTELDKHIQKAYITIASDITPYRAPLLESISVSDQCIVAISNKVHALKAEIDLLEKDACPTCKRPFTQESKESVNAKVTTLKSLNEDLSKLYTKKRAAHEKLVELDNRQQVINNTILELSSKRSACAANLAVINSSTTAFSDERISEISSVIDAFKPSGFPLYLIQKYIPSIQSAANSLVKTVFDDMQLSIITDSTKAGKLSLSIQVITAGVRRSLSACCGAETVLVNLCLRLAVISIFTKFRATICDVFIIDEGFEKFDDETSLLALSLLNYCMSIGFIKQAIIVTHKDSLKDLPNINYVKL